MGDNFHSSVKDCELRLRKRTAMAGMQQLIALLIIVAGVAADENHKPERKGLHLQAASQQHKQRLTGLTVKKWDATETESSEWYRFFLNKNGNHNTLTNDPAEMSMPTG